MRKLIEIQESGEPLPVVLVGVNTGKSDRTYADEMRELKELVRACNMEAVDTLVQNAQVPVQATLLGSGKVEELKAVLYASHAGRVVFNEMLTPAQFRNLQKILDVEVMDRTGLILRIFSDRARTREARLQVEYARLQYLMPRLTGMWTHFGRQAGGSGRLSNKGVGETQLELDRRHIERRMAELRRDLNRIDRERSVQREKRLSATLPRIALVGYTNAGKSTLMNKLLAQGSASFAEEKQVYAQDMLFATLDTTIRRIDIKGRKPFLLSDTVGFIRELPPDLVKAFLSTLEEVRVADLLLEVVDFSDPDYESRMEVTRKTLLQIGAGTIPTITVMNKTDLVLKTGESEDRPEEGREESADRNISDVALPYQSGDKIYISAEKGIGITELLDLIEKKGEEQRIPFAFLIPYTEAKVLSEIARLAVVETSEYLEEGVFMTGKINRREAGRYNQFETKLKKVENRTGQS